LRNRRSDVKTFETGLKIAPFDIIASWHPRVSGDSRRKWLRETLLVV
jgi:hypothetical protein